MINSQKRWVKSLIFIMLVLIITIAMFAILECVLRLVFGNPVKNSIQYSPYQFDPICQVSLKPNTTNTFIRSPENGGNKIIWVTNSQGLRNNELLQNHDYRVLIYGDSNILACFSQDSDTYVKRLQSGLLDTHPNKQLEVINCGIVGAGIDQLILKMQHDLPKLKPDLIILHIYASNDMGDIIRNRLFDIDEKGNLSRTKFPLHPDYKLTDKKGGLVFLFNTRLYDAATKINKLLTGINSNPSKFIQNIAKVNEAEYRVYTDHRPISFSHFDDHYDVDIATDPLSQSAVTKQKLLEKLLGEAKIFCSVNHTQFMVIIEPPVFDLCQNHLFGPEDLTAYEDYRPDNLSSAVEKASLTNGIPTLNLFLPFSRNNPQQLYFRINDDHWNDAGQKLAAELTTSFIQSNNIIPNF